MLRASQNKESHGQRLMENFPQPGRLLYAVTCV